MDNCDTVDNNEHPWLGRLIVVGLFLLAQGIAVVLVAFVALLVSFQPGWSATTEQASLLQPGDARSGTLLLSTTAPQLKRSAWASTLTSPCQVRRCAPG
jgi:Ca-activated chloride channel homolog